MERKKFLSIALFISLLSVPSFGQSELAISSLEKVLFPDNSESEKSIILEEFEWRKEKYIVKGRKNQPDISDSEKIEKLLLEVRRTKDTSVMPRLIELQNRFERIFLEEWEPAYLIGHPMFDFQYSTLMNMEMTLASLHVDGLDTPEDKYSYLKNIYMLQWVDGDSSRKERISFFSDYIKNKWNGGCIGANFCSPALIVEKARDMEEGILDDLANFHFDSLGKWERNYYLVTLGKAAIDMKSDKIEDIYIDRIEDFDRLVPDYGAGRNTWIYRILGLRGRPKGISFLLDELSSDEILSIPPHNIGLLRHTNVGKEIVEERLVREIQKSKGQKQGEYLTLLLNTVYNYQTDLEKIRQLSRIIDAENEMILSKFKEIKNK